MSHPNISESVVINAPKDVVWEVLADFPNIADWTASLKSSVQTSEAFNGVGAERHCELVPFGSLDERIVEWVPGEKIVIDVYKTTKIPVKRSLTTFSLEAIDAGTTRATMAPEPEAKGGPMAGVIEKRIRKGLPKAAVSLLNELKATTERQNQAAA